jgi:hypothetical protein
MLSLVTLNKINTHNTSCVLTSESLLNTCTRYTSKTTGMNHLKNTEIFYGVLGKLMGRDSSVGIATRYGLDSPGIKSQ